LIYDFFIKGVEDGDSGNDEPADTFYNGFQRPVQDVPGDQAAPSQDLARRLQLLSEMSAPRPQPFDGDSDYFQELPPEGMCLLLLFKILIIILMFIWKIMVTILLTYFFFLHSIIDRVFILG